MPGSPNKVLNSVQMVAGCDFHRTAPPFVPVLPFAPHVVAYCIGWSFTGASKKAPTVSAGWGRALGRQHDIGPGVYHFWPNALLPLIWAGAGNKAEFAAGTVKIPTGRMAVSLIPWVGLNLQLDCQDFPIPPAPTSICIASFNTVRAGFTGMDALGGALAMLFDSAYVWVLNGVLSFGGSALSNAMQKGLSGCTSGVLRSISRMGFVSPSFVRTAAYWLSTEAREFWTSAPNAIPAVASYLLSTFGVGSPLGYSGSYTPGGSWSGGANDAINDYVSPSPTGR
ncbi:hypothetical protein LZC95_46335 [Pendulispora brunnea]|uniref:Uncharacterized protein n=1 Tax=Pendulispora brunnea TaxID=2905690 RepID=A0ABZ2K959_9BACT